MVTLHQLYGLLALAITLCAFYPYIRDIHNGKTRPHIFSWVIWGSTTAVVGVAQFMEKGGAGSWSTIVSGCITFYIVYLAFLYKGDTAITWSDNVVFVISMSAIPVWIMTSNPLWAVVILTSVDVAGYYPTIRKTFHNPYSERLILYTIMTSRNLFSAIAMESYSLSTLLFPVATGLANVVLIGVTLLLRHTQFFTKSR